MGLRDRLEAKARRRVVVPVAVTDPAEDVVRAAEAQAAMLQAVVAGQDTTEADQTVQDAQDAVQGHYVDVAFTALAPDDFEAIASAFPSPDGSDAGMDWKRALPFLAAECADDEELRDCDWWAEQLTTDSTGWSHGEMLGLWNALLHLNVRAGDPHVPKG